MKQCCASDEFQDALLDFARAIKKERNRVDRIKLSANNYDAYVAFRKYLGSFDLLEAWSFEYEEE